MDVKNMDESNTFSILQKQNEALELKNQELQKQNENLRTQFEQALDVSSKLKMSSRKTKYWYKKIRLLQSEKDEVTKCLQLSNKTIDELKNQLRERDMQRQEIQNSQMINNKKQIEDNSYLIQELQIKTLQQNHQIEKAQMENELKQIFKISSEFFQQEIHNTSQLTKAFFESSQEISKNGQNQKYVLKIQKKLRKLKMEIIKENKLITEYSQQIQKNEQKINELQNQNNSLNQELSNLKQEKNEIKEKYDNIESENVQLKANLKLKKIKQNETKNEETINLIHKVDEISSLLKESKEKNKIYKETIANLQIKLNYQLELNENLKADKSNEINKKDSTISKLNEKCNELDLKIKEAQIQQNITSKFKEENSLIKEENDGLREEMEKLTNYLENQKNEFMQKINEKNTTIEHLESELKEVKHKLEIASKPIEISKLIPLASWSCTEMPSELTKIIENLINNDTLQLPSKIRNVISVICKWFTSKTLLVEKEIKEKNDKLFSLNTKVISLIELIKQSFPEVKFDIDSILENENIKMELSQHINNLHKELRSVKEFKNNIEEQTLDLFLTLKIDSLSEAKNAVVNMMKTFKTLTKKYQKVKKNNQIIIRNKKKAEENYVKIQENYSEIQEKNNQMINENKKLVFLIQNQQNQINELKKQLKQLKTELNKQLANIKNEKNTSQNMKEALDTFSVQNNSLKTQLEDCQNEIDEIKKHYKEKIKNERNESKTQFDKMLYEMKKKNSECCEIIQQRNITISTQKEEIEKLESTIRELNLRCQKLKTQINTIIAEDDQNQKSLKSQTNAKLMSLETEYKSKLQEAQTKIQKIQQQFIDILNQSFSTLISQQFNEENCSDLLNKISNDFSKMKTQDTYIRQLLKIQPNQAIDQVILNLKNMIKYLLKIS